MARRRKQRLDTTVYQTTIENLSPEGRGVGHVDGKAVFIQGALPQEAVSFRYVERKKAYDEAVTVSVEGPSKDRVAPPCPHFSVCGGCSLQHLSHEQQVIHKENVLKQHLKHIAKTTPDAYLDAMESADKGYRHKARLSVRYVQKKESVLVGFRERLQGRFITDMDSCWVLHPKVGENIDALKALILSLEQKQSIAQIEMAVGDNNTDLIIRNLEPLPEEDKARLAEFAQQKEVRIFLQPKGPDTVTPLITLSKEEEYLQYQLPDFDLTLKFKSTDFTQVNPQVNAKMVKQAMDLLAPQSHETVLDLFCGLGNFSLALARTAARVIGVEGSEEMVKRASMNAELNGLQNTEFHAADLTQPFKQFAWSDVKIDKLLIDPPRSGAKEIVSQIEHFNPEHILYVACDPATLARDIGILVHEKGYRLISAGVMDMFPHTAHVESMALLERQY